MAKKSKSQSRQCRKQRQISEAQEIELLKAWIESQKPDSGTNPLAVAPPPANAPAGRIGGAAYSAFPGCNKFEQLPISKKTKDALRQCKYVEMTDVQRASLPHSLSGRHIIGAAKTGSGKTLAFVIPVLVLDEVDQILDKGFEKALNAILSQLPKYRQTLLFSATQKKSVKELENRLNLKDPEHVSVHEESVTATPKRLMQTVMIVPLEQKLDMLWSFVRAHLNSKILVFLCSCKQGILLEQP